MQRVTAIFSHILRLLYTRTRTFCNFCSENQPSAPYIPMAKARGITALWISMRILAFVYDSFQFSLLLLYAFCKEMILGKRKHPGSRNPGCYLCIGKGFSLRWAPRRHLRRGSPSLSGKTAKPLFHHFADSGL